MIPRKLYMALWLQQRSGAASHHPNIKGQAEVATPCPALLPHLCGACSLRKSSWCLWVAVGTSIKHHFPCLVVTSNCSLMSR